MREWCRAGRVTYTRDGYAPVTIHIQNRAGGGVAGNILAGGIIGGVVEGMEDQGLFPKGQTAAKYNRRRGRRADALQTTMRKSLAAGKP